jgi:hypothetical protein
MYIVQYVVPVIHNRRSLSILNDRLQNMNKVCINNLVSVVEVIG